MTVREHKGEMEQQIIQLQCNLEKSELEIKECNKQVMLLNKKHSFPNKGQLILWESLILGHNSWPDLI